jgi:hypothetical protein
MISPSKKTKRIRHTTPSHEVFEKFYEKKTKDQEWDERKLRQRRLQHALMYMVEWKVRYGYFDWDVAGAIFEPSNPTPGGLMKRTMKSRTISQTHDELLVARMNELGLTTDYVADVLREALETARAKQDAATMVRIAAEINKMKGNYIQRPTSSVEESITQTSPLPGEILADYHKLTAKQEAINLPFETQEEQEIEE